MHTRRVSHVGHSTIQHNTMQHKPNKPSTAQHHTAQDSITQKNATLSDTMPHRDSTFKLDGMCLNFHRQRQAHEQRKTNHKQIARGI